MGVFEQFPYTNMHDLNLDWMLGVTKAVAEQVDANEQEIAAFEIRITTEIVPQKVGEKLDEMVNDGSMAEIVNERVLYMKADKEYVDALTSALNIGMRGGYDTYAQLVAAHPDGAEGGCYSVAADNKWYYFYGTWKAGGTWQNSVITDESIKAESLNKMMRRRFYPQVRQGVDPCYVAARTWATPSSVGLGSSLWKANDGIFSEGYYYLENHEVDVNFNDSYYIELDEQFRGRTDLLVRFEVSYISDGDAVFTMYQSDIKKSSGLYNGGTLNLPNSNGEEITLEMIAPIYAADVRYIKPNVNTASNSTLKVGSVKCSILTYTAGNVSPITSEADTALFTPSTDEYSLKDQTLAGMNDATKLQEKGVSISGRNFVKLNNVQMKNFKGGAGLYVADSYAKHDTLAATGCFFNDNAVGVNLEERGEYCNFNNCHFNGNVIGVKIKGGNNVLNACFINNNVDGIQLLPGENDSHGIISNCEINHNTGYAILIDGIGSGETFTGNHVYYGKVKISNTNGVIKFTGGTLKMDELTIDAAFQVYFDNVYIQVDPANVHLLNGGTIHGRNNICSADIDAIFNNM